MLNQRNMFWLNQSMTVGRLLRVRPRSVRANVERNRYMGWTRDGSAQMTVRMAVFPMMERVVETAEGDGDPDVVGLLKSRDACDNEVERVLDGVHHLGHDRRM